MAKDTYYFTHDYNTRSDNKVKRLILKHGMTGYGVFWSIVEDLYNNANALPMDYELIAFDLRVSEDLVKSVINDFDLFVIDGSTFGSTSVERRLNERNEKSLKAKRSAELRWKNKKETDANALPPKTDSNAKNEIKGNEIKGNEIKGNESKLDSSVEVQTSPPPSKKFDFKKALIEYGLNENLATEYMKVRKNKKAVNTEIALNAILKEIEISGRHIDECIEVCIVNSWKGFKAEWINNQSKTFSNGKSNTTLSANERHELAKAELARRDEERFSLFGEQASKI